MEYNDPRIKARMEAIAEGYMELTSALSCPKDQRFLDRIIADMERGGIDYCIVKAKRNPHPRYEVWRKPPDDYTWSPEMLQKFKVRQEIALTRLCEHR